jgi:hypothetical protein
MILKQPLRQDTTSYGNIHGNPDQQQAHLRSISGTAGERDLEFHIDIVDMSALPHSIFPPAKSLSALLFPRSPSDQDL